jgi:hypothetical protein
MYNAYNGWAAASFGCQERFKAGSKELKDCIDNIPTPTSPYQPGNDPTMHTMNQTLEGLNQSVNIGGQDIPILYLGVAAVGLVVLFLLLK